MSTPQSAIFASPGPHHLFLEFSIPASGADPRPVLANAWDHLKATDGVEAVIGFGAGLWAALAPKLQPKGLAPFHTLEGRGGKRVPGTQNDLWVWISSAARDQLFDAGHAFHRRLSAVGALRLEQAGFKYLDNRDLTGFIDGTANPEGDERLEVALVPAGKPGADGSHVLAQRWVHNLEAFHTLPVDEQERVIGRTKADSEELSADEKPEWAHIARTEIERDGEELAIYRRSVPFGGMARHGLYFQAFSAEPERYGIMLRSMFGLTDDGVVDRLTDFSAPESSALYFAPSQEALAQALGAGRKG